MADARLVIRNLNKSYASPVLCDVSLSIARGEKSRDKWFRVGELSEEDLQSRLHRLLEE